MVNFLHAPAEFSEGDHAQIKWRCLLSSLFKEFLNTGVGFLSLADFTDDIGINQIH